MLAQDGMVQDLYKELVIPLLHIGLLGEKHLVQLIVLLWERNIQSLQLHQDVEE